MSNPRAVQVTQYLVSLARPQAEVALRAQYPEEPWKWNPSWALGEGESTDDRQFRGLALTGFLLLGFSVAMADPVFRLFEAGKTVVLVTATFPLIGVLILYSSFKHWARNRKFGAARLKLDSFPVPLGGGFSATLSLPRSALRGHEVELSLVCKRTYVRGSGKNQSIWTELKWKTQWTAEAEIAAGTTLVNLRAQIPFELPPSNRDNLADTLDWELTASSREPGLDFHATFRIPVFKTSESNSEQLSETLIRAQAEEERRRRESEGPQAPGNRTRFYAVAQNGDREIYRMKRGSTASVGFALFMFGLVFVAVGLGMITQALNSHIWFRYSLWVFVAVFSPAGILLAAAGLAELFGRSTLVLEPGCLVIRKSVLGIRSTRRLNRSDVHAVELITPVRSGDQIWYDVKFSSAPGAKGISAGCRIPDKREAEILALELERKLAA